MPVLALLFATVAPVCPPQRLNGVHFQPGETLSYRVDVLGVDVGTFEVRAQPPPAGDKHAALQLSSRAKTSAFVSTNAGQYDAFATALLGPDFTPLHYREDLDDGPVHLGVDLDFPPANGTLPVRATRNGEPGPFTLPAGPGVRDVISTFYLMRAQPMRPGTPVCVEVFAGRKIWKVDGKVAARETINTPLGRFSTVRVDLLAVRTDDPNVRRAAHVWVTDDEHRIPLVAIGEMRGKVLRAQLTTLNGARRRIAGR